MRRLFGILVVLAIGGLVSATTATAQTVTPTSVTQTGGLHFVGQPTVTANKTFNAAGFLTSATLTCTGEVAGAGTTAGATCTATAVVTQGCVNRGGNEPSGLEQSFQTVTGSVTFQTRQGRGSFSVTTSGISPTLTCPSANMTPVLISVTFTDITLTVTSQTGTTV